MKISVCFLFRLSSSTSAESCLSWPLQPKFKVSSQLHNIEKYWKERQVKCNRPKDEQSPSKYVLAMFPYPSGRLHMGHLRVYTISDVCARYFALNGFSVIHPIGWDAFGLPAENAALERGIDPKIWTYDNINMMRKQLKCTGVQFDWDREIFTCKSEYYKWTQWIFLQLFENGLARRVLSEVYWDPVDKTVLAAEQIDGNGRSWRSGAVAEKRKLRQWVIDTPKFATRLLNGLETLRFDWDEIADIQANWIGKCDVYRFLLPMQKEGKPIEELFDLRLQNPKDLVNGQFIIVTSDHPLTPKTFKTDKSSDPENCEFDAQLARDFALNFSTNKCAERITSCDEIQSEAEKNGYGGYLTSRTLRDWVVSRQRAWGTPIPIVLDPNDCLAATPVSLTQLPILLEQRGQQFPCKKFSSGVGILETDTLDTFFDSSWYYLRFLDPRNRSALVSPKMVEKQMPIDIYVGGVEHADIHLFYARFISHFLYDLGVLRQPEPFNRLISQGVVRGKTFKLKIQEVSKSQASTMSTIYVNSNDIIETHQGSSQFVQTSTGKPVVMTFEKMSKSKKNGVDPVEIIQHNTIDLTRLLLLDAASPRLAIDWGTSTKLKGLLKWVDRMAWVVSTYVEQRQKIASTSIDDNTITVSDNVEKMFKDTYNYFVRYVSSCIEIVHVHSTAIARLQSLTNVLRKSEPEILGRSAEAERCIHALVIMLQLFAPNLAAEYWSALKKAPKLCPELWRQNASVAEQNWPKTDIDSMTEIVLRVYNTTIRAEACRFIESLTVDELISKAKSHYHVLFFQLLNEKKLKIESIDVNINPGLQVVLNIKMSLETKKSDITDVLQRVSLESVRLQKEKKRKRVKMQHENFLL